MKKRVHTWILISSFVITITSPHDIRSQEKLEFGQKTVKVADWSISWKTKIWYEMILIFYENAAPVYYLLSTVWGASDILLTKSKDRRLYTTTRFYLRSSRVHNYCSSLWKKYHNHCVFLKKRFLKDWIIYTQSL